MSTGLFANDRICTTCQTAYSSRLSSAKCPNCLSTSWSRIPDAPIPGVTHYRQAERPFTTVSITGLELSWGDVFAIAFKFMVVFAVFQVAFVVIALLIWGAP